MAHDKTLEPSLVISCALWRILRKANAFHLLRSTHCEVVDEKRAAVLGVFRHAAPTISIIVNVPETSVHILWCSTGTLNGKLAEYPENSATSAA